MASLEVIVLTVLFTAILLYMKVHDIPSILQAIQRHLIALGAAIVFSVGIQAMISRYRAKKA